MAENLKRKVLYVDRMPIDNSAAKELREMLHDMDVAGYDFDFHLTLNPDVLNLLHNAVKRNSAYEVLLTHVPFNQGARPSYINFSDKRDFYSQLYGDSLGLLRDIKRDFPKMPIVAYTGADRLPVVEKLFLEVAGGVVFKSDDGRVDAYLIGEHLKRLLG